MLSASLEGKDQADYAIYWMKSAKWVGSQQVVGRPGVYFHKEMNMLHVTRRQLLLSAGAGAAAWALSPLSTWAADDAKGFTLPKLPYDYDALEPSIDAHLTFDATRNKEDSLRFS